MGFEEFARFYRPILNFTEEDFYKLLSTLRLPLPSALRVTNTVFSDKVHTRLSRYRKSKYFTNVYEADRKYIPTRGFIVNQTRAGNIQRQEVVSMLPVLLMDMKDHYSVLDMCAAPGSKTKQLLEIVGDKGLVVCNDASSKRMRILVSETCKIPRKGFLVLGHDASALPLFKTDFDRVLCDVPCSGDGTSRKNYDVIPTWDVSHALSLCELQFRILKQATKFIKDDGMVIYSTCSLNPIENECIVQKAVMELDLEIVDLRDNVNEKYMSKDFKLRSGFTTWSMDVKSQGDISLEPISEDIGLSKCIRVFPHDQNTGGFFIVGLRKKNSNNKKCEISDEKIEINDKQSEINNDNIECNDIENKLEDLKVSSKPRFTEVEGEMRDLLEKEYDIKDKHLVQKTNNPAFIFEVSKEVLDILKNNELNVHFHGYKLFEENTLNESGFSIRTVYGDYTPDVELTGETMEEAIINKEVSLEMEKGSIIVLFKDYETMVSGYSHGDKVTLNIGDRLQRSLRDYIKKINDLIIRVKNNISY